MIRNHVFLFVFLILFFSFCSTNNKSDTINQTDTSKSYIKPTQIILIFEDVLRKSEENIRNYKATINSSTMHLRVYNAYKVFHDTTFSLPENFFDQMLQILDSLKLQKKEEIMESGCDSGKNYKIKLFDNQNNELLSGYAYYCGKLASGNLNADPRPLFEKLKLIPGFEKLVKK